MKRTMIILIVMIASVGRTQSLQETVKIALKNNGLVQASKEELIAASALHKASRRSVLPRLTLKSSATYITDVAEIDLNAMTGMPLGSISMGAKESVETSASLSCLLFSGFARRSNIRIREEQETLARIGLNRTEKETALQTATVYRSIQGLKLKIGSLESAVKRADIQLRRIRSLIESGMALGIDSLSVSLGRLTYKQRLIASRASLASAFQRLEMLTGEAIDVTSPAAGNAESLNDLKLQSTDMMLLLTAQYRLKQHAEVLARSAYYPRVSFQASYKYGKPGVDFIQNEWMNYGVAAVGLEWDLFNWGSEKQKVTAAAAEKNRVGFERMNTEQEIRLQYDVKVRELQSIRDQVAVVERARDLAGEKMRIINLQSEEGMISATDFNDANLELTQAELDVQEHRIRLAQKIHEIDYLSGAPLQDWHLE